MSDSEADAIAAGASDPNIVDSGAADRSTGGTDVSNQDSCETVTLKSNSSSLCLLVFGDDSLPPITPGGAPSPSGFESTDTESEKEEDAFRHDRLHHDCVPDSNPFPPLLQEADKPKTWSTFDDNAWPAATDSANRNTALTDHAYTSAGSRKSASGSTDSPASFNFPNFSLVTTSTPSIDPSKESTVASSVTIASSVARNFIASPIRAIPNLPSNSAVSQSAPAANGSRPETLSLVGVAAGGATGGAGVASSGGAGASQRRHHRAAIAKKESYSSLSEYSSRSSSMDQLIEAAISTPLHAQGTVDVDGDMITFVADGINELIKRSRDSSAMASWNSSMSRSSSSLSSSTSGWSAASASANSRNTRSPSVVTGSPDEIPPIDPRVLLDLEGHAHRVADNLDLMMTSLTAKLHLMSSCTYQCVDVYKEAVDSSCDSVDASIKSMYALMAKCEELSQAIKPVYRVQQQVLEIKRLLDLFEAQIGTDET